MSAASEHKLLIHLIARSGLEADIAEMLTPWTGLLAKVTQSRGTALLAQQDDSFRVNGEGNACRAFDATIELLNNQPDGNQRLLEITDQLTELLEPLVQIDLSAIQIGSNFPLRPSAPTPIRFQYLMRRRADFDHQRFLARYREIHAQFGLEQPGIEGYTQFHIDLDHSRAASMRSGLGIWGVDSVSEMHIADLETYLQAVEAHYDGSAGEDEERFVDRPNSVMWISNEVFRTF